MILKEEKEIFELDEYNIDTSGDLTKDAVREIDHFDMEEKSLPNIEVKEMIIKETGNFLNLKENIINIPIEMIVFPFFTPQKQNKRVNFKYSFQDLGVTMYCTLVSKDESDKVFQPSIFEEKIYNYLISMYEQKREINDTDEYIEFEISDFICGFLGNKMNRAYYSKVEQSLKNLKNTEYQFVISNHSKLGKYKFEDEEFKLLTYQKLKLGKKVFYRVTLNKNIRKKIKDKRYIKYNSKNLLEIIDKDVVASRIYKYISKIRYSKIEDEIPLKTLAAIIPLKTEQIVSRINKKGEKRRYKLSRVKQIKKRIEKAFNVLIKLGYIKSVKIYDKKGEIVVKYQFNIEKDNKCHVSSYIGNKIPKLERVPYEKNNEIDINRYKVEEAIIIDNQDILKAKIKKAKQNMYISKLWNKRVDNKIKRLVKQKGEEFVVKILDILYTQVNYEIRTTLVQYINGIVNNLEKNSDIVEETIKVEDNLTLFEQEKKENKGNKTKELSDEEIKKIFNSLDELEKASIEKQALEICEKREKVSIEFLIKLKNQNQNIYMLTILKFIGEILIERNLV
ncbi:hypothetical protein EV215_1374 [Hypnocyclicus thermotrophus]|uniref:Chromosomal replication initiator DnaA n=1 Tax=Hypnocyclicus thermotrophus TaxID=1627895 RepID=A0AA46DYP2_9FUSO|nr:chromosomal replication initiator DnaA [Hypnocyclicus thermotrophus]TDT69832.1 hypothetical protein EV215_1374 [Hypnocyclicus thermotrophus]